jgi:hypothetical protein
MKQCFKTSGQDCACEEIPFYDFSIACSRAAPLAIACDIDGEEIACDDLENLEMPELPDWLEPIWEDLEEEMMKAQYDMHMPRECVEAGVTSPRECGRVMIETHAPLECKSALLSSGCEDERECREICDAIMFELHTPQECIDGGITDPEECARFMDSFRGPGGGLRGPDCGRIEDPMERLECYDNRGNEFEDHYGPGEGYEGEGELTWQCRENRIHWPPDCETFMREEWPEQERRLAEEGEQRRENEEDWRVQSEECANSCDLENGWWDFRDENGDGVKECVCYATEGPGPSSEEESRGPGCDDCSSQCPAGANTDCVNDQCVCGEVPDTSPQYAEGEGPGEPGDFDNSGEAPTTDSSNGGEGGDSTETSSETTETTTESPITGEVVENPFLKYYRR